MVEFHSDNEKVIGVCCLLLSDGIVELVQCLVSISAGGNVHCHHSNGNEFP